MLLDATHEPVVPSTATGSFHVDRYCCADLVVPASVLKLGPKICPVLRIPTVEIETAVIDHLRALIRAPEIIVRTWMVARKEDSGFSEAEVRNTLVKLDPLWGEFFAQLLDERMDVGGDSIIFRTGRRGWPAPPPICSGGMEQEVAG